MPPKYFQGLTLQGPVKASHARSFREVVDELRICPTLGLSRSKFLSLSKEKRNEAKSVKYFTPACFRSSPSKRLTSEATHCNLIFIDIDETEGGLCPAAPFFNDPKTLYSALEGYNFAAHTTASHTPQKPRMRIVVDAQEIPLSRHREAVRTITRMLGLSIVTKESKVAIQPMYLPTLFSDSTEADHPLIAYHLDSRAFTQADITDALSDDPKAPRIALEVGIDALEFLRAPVPEITLLVAKQALASIDPDCSYWDWMETSAALRHQFSHTEDDENAFDAWDQWSALGTKYGGSESTRKKWESFRPTPIGRLPVTIRSLLRQAVAAGWDDKKVKETVFQNLMRWIDEVDTFNELMEKGVQKILAAPLLSSVQEDVLIQQMCQQAKKRFEFKISTTAFRKDLLRLKGEIKEKQKSQEPLKEPRWAKGLLYISKTHELYRHHTGERFKFESFNAKYSRNLLPSEEELKSCGLPVNPATLAKPIVLPTDFTLNHLKITTVYDYAYDPAQPAEMFFVKKGTGIKYVNTYSPTHPELDPNHSDIAGMLFEYHLSNLIAEPEYRQTLIDYFAFMVQNPGRKIRWAIFIQSVDGAGKSFLTEAMKAVLGKEHVKIVSGETIKTGYNEWSTGYQLVVIEEVRVAGATRHDIMNKLKPLITNDEISVDQKYRDNRSAVNNSCYMLFSNHHDALAITHGNRRYFVVKSPLQTKPQVLALGANYFPALFQMVQEDAGALRSYFHEWKISPNFNPDGHPPQTTYEQELINDSASDVVASVRRLLLEGDYPLVQYDIVSSATLLNALQISEGVKVTTQQLGSALRDEGLRPIGRYTIGTERHYLWVRGGMGNNEAAAIAAEREKKELKIQDLT